MRTPQESCAASELHAVTTVRRFRREQRRSTFSKFKTAGQARDLKIPFRSFQARYRKDPEHKRPASKGRAWSRTLVTLSTQNLQQVHPSVVFVDQIANRCTERLLDSNRITSLSATREVSAITTLRLARPEHSWRTQARSSFHHVVLHMGARSRGA